jgi:hypothetical protein
LKPQSHGYYMAIKSALKECSASYYRALPDVISWHLATAEMSRRQ